MAQVLGICKGRTMAELSMVHVLSAERPSKSTHALQMRSYSIHAWKLCSKTSICWVILDSVPHWICTLYLLCQSYSEWQGSLWLNMNFVAWLKKKKVILNNYTIILNNILKWSKQFVFLESDLMVCCIIEMPLYLILNMCFVCPGMEDYLQRYREGMKRVLNAFGPVPDFFGEPAARIIKVCNINNILWMEKFRNLKTDRCSKWPQLFF